MISTQRNADFFLTSCINLYLSFLKNNENRDESQLGKEKNLMLSPNSSVNTDISAIDKMNRSITSGLKKKYPFIMEKDQNINSPRQLFYRLYSKENSITPQIVSIINTTATLADEMLGFEKDDLQIMNLCFNHSEIHAIKYEEMLLVISSPASTPITSQIKRLYSWAKLLIV